MAPTKAIKPRIRRNPDEAIKAIGQIIETTPDIPKSVKLTLYYCRTALTEDKTLLREENDLTSGIAEFIASARAIHTQKYDFNEYDNVSRQILYTQQPDDIPNSRVLQARVIPKPILAQQHLANNHIVYEQPSIKKTLSVNAADFIPRTPPTFQRFRDHRVSSPTLSEYDADVSNSSSGSGSVFDLTTPTSTRATTPEQHPMVKTWAELKTDNNDPAHKPYGTYSFISTQSYPEHVSNFCKAGSALGNWSPDPSTLPVPSFYPLQQKNTLLEGSLPDTPSTLKPLQRIIGAAKPEYKKHFDQLEDENKAEDKQIARWLGTDLTMEIALLPKAIEQQPQIAKHILGTNPIIHWLDHALLVDFERLKQQAKRAWALKVIKDYKDDLFEDVFHGPIEL
jgi:hypothetical protein